MASSIVRAVVLGLALGAAAQAFAQTGPAPQSPSSPSESPAPPAGAAGPQTLAPNSADPSSPDEVTLQARPALALSGSANWDDGFPTLKATFDRLQAELGKAGLKAAGRPLALFTQTDDAGFRFDAMIPVEEGSGAPTLSEGIRLGRTPEGAAVRFLHKGPYDDIDSTYETVTAYLDVKGVVVKDTFIEEYLNDLTNAADPVEVNIYALPK